MAHKNLFPLDTRGLGVVQPAPIGRESLLHTDGQGGRLVRPILSGGLTLGDKTVKVDSVLSVSGQGTGDRKSSKMLKLESLGQLLLDLRGGPNA